MVKKDANEAARAGTPFAHYGAFALVVVIVAALAFTLGGAQSAAVQPTPTPLAASPTPGACIIGMPQNHSLAEATVYLERIMATYKDMMRSGVPTPSFDACNGTWSAVVRIPDTNGERRVLVRFNDTPIFSLDKAYLEIVRASFITESRIVTNGTMLIAGKINCSNSSRPRMMEFSDPYCPSCLLGDVKIDAFRAEYGDGIDFDYHILPSTMQVMENSYGKTDVNRFAYYIVCAQKQGLLDAFKPCAEQKYRQKGVEAPLTKEELDACLPAALNQTAFDACVPTAFSDVTFDGKMAETYGVTETPVVLFDCQYRVLPEYLEHGYCSLYNATGCTGP